MKKLIWQVVLVFTFLLNAECSSASRHKGTSLLSDNEANVFFKKFLQNRDQSDFMLKFKIESSSKQTPSAGGKGVILHHKVEGEENYYVEIKDKAGNYRKFLLRNGQTLTNFTETFNSNEPFISGTLYSPNDLLLPFLGPNCSFKYCGPKKVCGRTAQQFLVKVKDNILKSNVKYVRMSIDNVFLHPLEIEYLGSKQELLSRQRVLSLHKQDDSWELKTVEIFNALTHERAKITIVKSDFNVEFEDSLFELDFLQKTSAQ
ncbi:MAG: hypothetical protein LBF25_01860 [Puniceicoccales bacterium]|jgi:hypothetical protein|nr:hypothetical protein [Puniceicoccales bacterium]